ncbi:MAG: hypothetical protein AABW92_01080 [Nanoarchaeota archaeon]
MTEVMYTPLDGNEWVELYANESYNLSNLEIKDNFSTDQITCCGDNLCGYVVPENTYFIISEQDNTLNFSSLIFCVDDNSIGNGLGNSWDNITLLENNISLDNVFYGKETEKGNSLSKINNIWLETTPTPGAENFFYEEQINEIPDIRLGNNLPEIVFTNVMYKPFIIENLDYPEFNEQINSTIYYNVSRDSTILKEGTKEVLFKSHTITISEVVFEIVGNHTTCSRISTLNVNDTNFTNNFFCKTINVVPSEQAECNISLKMTTDKQIYEEGENVNIFHNLNNKTFPFEIEYWIEDIFGEVVKQKTTTSNTDKKSYTPKIIVAEKAFVVSSNLTHTACNNIENNTLKQSIVVFRGNVLEEKILEKEIKNSIAIVGISPPNPAFGDIIKIKLEIAKGNTSKNAIKTYVKGKNIISETSSFNIYGTNKEFSFSIPLLLKDNCNNKYDAGEYEVIVEGLELEVLKTITIKANPSCPTENNIEKAEQEKQSPAQKPIENITEKSVDKITGRAVYESAILKSKEYMKYFLLIISLSGAFLVLEKLRKH